MTLKNVQLSILAILCLALTGCMNLGGLSYKQARVLKKEGFVLTDEGWSLGLPERLLFGFNESNINTERQTELVRLATQLNKYHLDKLKIVGHTDNIGNPEYNLKLSKERAQNVSNIFIGQKFNPQNIQVIGKGADQPLKSNDSEENKAENRRVAVIIIP
ncbi:MULTISPECIES: OmpA family protein [Acinetobacter]|uniref:OmpA family protein n=1 Tax=Acinetobacter TaxID=469 RepID=UPI000CFFD896|nr:OmpA family protein [Acinetobacter sp. MYb10]QLD62895.1 OmpA family protein [Acinetobacter sp. MYb10]